MGLEALYMPFVTTAFAEGAGAGVAGSAFSSTLAAGAGATTVTGLSTLGAAVAGGVVSAGVSAGLAAAMKPKIPGPPSLAPTSDDARMAAAAAMKMRGKRGRESTILSGVASPSGPAANPVKNVLGL
jgi:hypothetical protein